MSSMVLDNAVGSRALLRGTRFDEKHKQVVEDQA